MTQGKKWKTGVIARSEVEMENCTKQLYISSTKMNIITVITGRVRRAFAAY